MGAAVMNLTTSTGRIDEQRMDERRMEEYKRSDRPPAQMMLWTVDRLHLRNLNRFIR
jgi:hypothetical protein